MGRYRKIPVEVDAIRYTGDNLAEVEEFMGGKGKVQKTFVRGPGRGMRAGIKIQTLEGTMSTAVGSWIIRGIKGEYYPCREDIFEQTHEEVLEQVLLNV